MDLSSVQEGPAPAAPGPLPQSGFAIVAETPADARLREALLDRAMGPRWKKKSSQKLRRGRRPSPGLAFVARAADGRVAGSVRLWDVRAGRNGPAALLLGPLAVDPALKGAGLGSALMRHALEEAARLGHRAVVLVGDASYYGRFGFSAERTPALSMPGPYEPHRFLAKELVEGALDGAHGTLEPTGRLVKAERAARAA
jgi:predicted N-acetyltransferase YhbS